MNKVKVLLVVFMLIGITFIGFAMMTKHPVEVAISGVAILSMSSICFYALNIK